MRSGMGLLHGSRSVALLVPFSSVQSGTLVIAVVIATGELGRNAFLWLLSWALVALGLGSGNHGFRYSSRVYVVPTLWKRCPDVWHAGLFATFAPAPNIKNSHD